MTSPAIPADPAYAGRQKDWRSSRTTLLVCTVFVPAMVVALDILLHHFITRASSSTWLAAIFYFVLAGQIALLGWSTERFAADAPLRSAAFVWSLALAQLLVYALVTHGHAWNNPQMSLGISLVLAQLNLLLLWGGLGSGLTVWRLPSIGAVFALAATVYVQSHTAINMGYLMLTQLASSVLLCLLLRGTGRRFVKMRIPTTEPKPPAAALQFRVGDMLVWMLSLAFILAWVRTAPTIAWSISVNVVLQFIVTVAVLTLVALASVWALLGERRRPLRIGLLLTTPLLAGGLVWGLAAYWLSKQPLGIILDLVFAWRMYLAADTGPWWIAWMYLYAAYLAAVLWRFRLAGYRLARPAPASQATE